VLGEERLVLCEVLVFGGGEEGRNGMGVEGVEGMDTFFILARKKLRTRNLNLSSSVWMTMSLKFAFGSMLPVWSSTNSI
jgi:hypothetical protein